MTPPPYQGSGGVTDACLVQRAGVIFDGYRLVGVRTGVNQPNDYRERHQELDCKSLTNKALLRFGWVAEWSKAAVLKTADVQKASGGSNPLPSAFLSS